MKNRLKERLQTEDISYGLWNTIVDTYVGEICASAGYDWVVIDAEHAPFDERTILSQLQSMAAYTETQVLVRPPSGNPVLLKKLLDFGVQSFVIPMIETREQAEEMVRAVLYPPEGIRGVAPALARASRWGTIEDYAKNANQEICLILQIESKTGIDNLEEISQVKGVDGLFIGPADLAASYGHIGDADHPEIEHIIQNALGTIRRSGKTAGILALGEQEIQSYMEQGANFIGIGVDLLMLASQVRGTISNYKKK